MSDEAPAIVMAGRDGRITHWNDGAEALFGFTSADALGQSLDLVVPEDFRARHWAGFHRAMETGQCNLDRAATNLLVRCADGTVRPFPARFVFLTDARDAVIGAIGLYTMPRGGEQPFGPILE